MLRIRQPPASSEGSRLTKGALQSMNTAARHRLIETQLRRRGIDDDAVLRAFAEVDRADFVPDESLEDAYADSSTIDRSRTDDFATVYRRFDSAGAHT